MNNINKKGQIGAGITAIPVIIIVVIIIGLSLFISVALKNIKNPVNQDISSVNGIRDYFILLQPITVEGNRTTISDAMIRYAFPYSPGIMQGPSFNYPLADGLREYFSKRGEVYPITSDFNHFAIILGLEQTKSKEDIDKGAIISTSITSNNSIWIDNPPITTSYPIKETQYSGLELPPPQFKQVQINSKGKLYYLLNYYGKAKSINE